jgi:2-dehydro-3-deoxygluconokinase
VKGGAIRSARPGTATGSLEGEIREALHLATLGEALVVMDPLSRGPIRHVSRFEKHVGGAELNVAVGLSRLGLRARWAGRLGDDEFGKEILAFARGEGVDVSRASLDPVAPTGLYFKEWRALGQLRAYYYHRAGSAASRMRFDELDLEYLLSGDILHLTGVTAALSQSCRDLVECLLSAANDRGVKISFDLNVRWTLFDGRDPRKVLEPLAARADLLFLSDDEAELLFGGSDPDSVHWASRSLRAETVVIHRTEGAFAVEGAASPRRLPIRWTWWTPWGRGMRSSLVSCPDGCEGGAPRSAWKWQTPAERAL